MAGAHIDTTICYDNDDNDDDGSGGEKEYYSFLFSTDFVMLLFLHELFSICAQFVRWSNERFD